MAAIIVGILGGLGGLLVGGLAMAAMAILSRVLGFYRTVAEMGAKAKTVTMGSAGAGARSVSHAEIERLTEGGHHLDERRPAA
jgi:hypothetical protein